MGLHGPLQRELCLLPIIITRKEDCMLRIFENTVLRNISHIPSNHRRYDDIKGISENKEL
jgi:hypothetical protein